MSAIMPSVISLHLRGVGVDVLLVDDHVPALMNW